MIKLLADDVSLTLAQTGLNNIQAVSSDILFRDRGGTETNNPTLKNLQISHAVGLRGPN